MTRWILVLAAVLAATVAQAAAVEEIVIFKINTPGYYIVQAGKIVPFGTPTPDPTPIPTPDVLTERAKAIMAEAVKATKDPNREQTAHQLAELYRQIGNKINEKSITGQEMIQLAVKFGTDQLLNGKGSAATKAWQPTRDVFAAELAKVLNAGGSDADFVKLLMETADGLAASAPNADPQIDIEMILAIIKLIMELIALLS